MITVCSSAAGETCPAYLGPVLRTHWGVDDPAHATGTDAQIDAAFIAAYRTLRNRIEAFLALPLDQLRSDRARLKAEMDRIGTASREEQYMSAQCEVTAQAGCRCPDDASSSVT